MSILIQSVEWNGSSTDVFIEGNRISRIEPRLQVEADVVIDGKKKALIPGFVNMHTHSAMTLFRGFGDDLPLMTWLKDKIWPNEAKLTEEDIYWGARLACLEMIKSGTTTFFDMYYNPDVIAQAVDEMGLRAMLSEPCFDHFTEELREQSKKNIESRFRESASLNERICFSIGAHAIYTVSGELLQWISAFAAERGIPVQLHLAETEDEMNLSIERFKTTPVRYLKELGVLSPDLILSHVLHVDEDEIAMLADYDVKIAHNPASNMKLASGYQFKYSEMCQAGLTVGLGTDGCASSNNLDMVEAMKLASLLGKVWRKDPEALPCEEMLQAATQAGASVLHPDLGRVEEGSLADVCLIDLEQPVFTPNFNFVSNLVYAANGSCVDTVICNGRLLMQNKQVPGEKEILEKAASQAESLIRRQPRRNEFTL